MKNRGRSGGSIIPGRLDSMERKPKTTLRERREDRREGEQSQERQRSGEEAVAIRIPEAPGKNQGKKTI